MTRELVNKSLLLDITLVIELTPEEEARLRREAQERGMEVEELARKLIEQGLPADKAPDMENQALINLLRRWREEDAALTPEEADEAESDWRVLNASLTENRLSLAVPDVSDHD